MGHSFSRDYFSRKFAAEQTDAEYLNFEVQSLSELARILKTHPELDGLNVTIPHKVAVLEHLDEIDDTARKIGAVNVIVFRKDASGRTGLKGYNSDVTGFEQSLAPLLGPSHRKALILGTGGSSKAVCHGLERLGLEPLFVSRTEREGCLTYGDLSPALMAERRLIVNTTPLGMFPNVQGCPPIPYELLSSQHLLYDLIYNPEETLFMRKGREHGASVKNGLEMLHLQAAAAWTLWNRHE